MCQAEVIANSKVRTISVYCLSLKSTDVILNLSFSLTKAVNVNQSLKKISK